MSTTVTNILSDCLVMFIPRVATYQEPSIHSPLIHDPIHDLVITSYTSIDGPTYRPNSSMEPTASAKPTTLPAKDHARSIQPSQPASTPSAHLRPLTKHPFKITHFTKTSADWTAYLPPPALKQHHASTITHSITTKSRLHSEVTRFSARLTRSKAAHEYACSPNLPNQPIINNKTPNGFTWQIPLPTTVLLNSLVSTNDLVGPRRFRRQLSDEVMRFRVVKGQGLREWEWACGEPIDDDGMNPGRSGASGSTQRYSDRRKAFTYTRGEDPLFKGKKLVLYPRRMLVNADPNEMSEADLAYVPETTRAPMAPVRGWTRGVGRNGGPRVLGQEVSAGEFLGTARTQGSVPHADSGYASGDRRRKDSGSGCSAMSDDSEED